MLSCQRHGRLFSPAFAFYETVFDAVVFHRVGQGDDIVAQLAVGTAEFWAASE